MTTPAISRPLASLLRYIGLTIALASLSVLVRAEGPIVDEDYVLNSNSMVMRRIAELTRANKDYSQWLEEGLVDICLYEDATTYFVEFKAKHIERKPGDPPPRWITILEIFNSLLVDKKTLEAKEWVFETEMREMPKVFIGATGSLPLCSIFRPLNGSYRIVPADKRPAEGSQSVVPSQDTKQQR